jgi:GTPase SAR1 family protein
LIVYDITNRSSFQNLDSWFKEIENQGEQNCMNVLVGNKCDLADARQVETEEGRKYAAKRNIRFVETSAADNTNVDLVFTSLMQDIYKGQKGGLRRDQPQEPNNTQPSPQLPGPKDKDTIRLDDPAITQPKKDPACAC